MLLRAAVAFRGGFPALVLSGAGDRLGFPDEPMKSSAYICCALLTLAAMAAAAIPIIWASDQAVRTMFNAPLRWVPRDTEARKGFNRFLEEFDCHELVLVSWAGCTVDDQRLEKVADALTAARDARAAAGEAALYSQVMTGYTVLRGLTAAPVELTRSEAIDRLEGILVGPDRSTSCAVIALTDYGAEERREAIEVILNAVRRATGYEREDLYLTGAPVDGIAIDDESILSIQYYALPSALVSLALCCLCLRSMWLTLPIVAVGALGQGLMLAMVHVIGVTMNAILIVLPPLVFVLTVSAGVHLVHYLFDEVRTGNVENATTGALLKGWGPCVLAAVTTAIGLGSLLVSEVGPVRQFGALAAFGVLLTVAALFLLLPGAMEIWLWLRHRLKPSRQEADGSAREPRRDVWRFMASGISRYANWVTLSSFVLMTLCGVGLVWIRASIDVVALLAAENRAVQDFRWFEANIGPQIPVEVVLHFDAACRLDPLQRLEMVRDAQEQINRIDILDGAMSVASFFPDIPQRKGLRSAARRAVIQRQLRERREDLIRSEFLSAADHEESWRISARILGRKDFDYGRFLDRLRERVSPVITRYEQAGYAGVTATYTGVTSVVYEVELSLLADLFRSFMTALAIIGLVMIAALRSVRAGLVAMIPNIFPMMILFGAMGWLERPVDIGTVMTASVALGIAVDGTFHFLKWFRRETGAGKTRRQAVRYSFQHCGRALAQTTVICACGLLVYGQSGFLPARHFAWMLLLLLIAAMVGDLVVLPALLLGPLGRFFAGARPGRSSAETASTQRGEDKPIRSARFDPGGAVAESTGSPPQARVPPGR